MKSVFPVIYIFLSLAIFCSGVGHQPPQTDHGKPFIDVETLPRLVRRTLNGIHVGMTRMKVEKILSADGGLLLGGHERYYVPGYTMKSKWVMVEIEFQPPDMPDAIFGNERLRVEWLSDHNWGAKRWGDAIVRRIGKPYLSRVAID